ncbi:MAG: S8 family serine peptidase [Caulobacteraceae bacterium]
MAHRILSFVLGLAIWLAAGGLCFAAEASAHPPGADDPSHRILVLLRLSPEHFRPNSAYGDAYDDGQARGARRRIASRLAREHGLTLVDDWPMPLLGVDCFIMAVPVDRSPDKEAAILSGEPSVAWSEPVKVYQAQGAPAREGATLFRVQPAAREWRLADLHQMATGRNVSVAVIDSAIDTTHPDLVGRIQTNQNFVPGHPDQPERHGTGVAGVIAAQGIGIVGVAPRARLMALRACWQLAAQPARPSTTVCDSLSLAEALHFAIEHNAQVINLSLSGPPDPLLGKLLDVALARGVTVVGAFDRDLPDGGFPASHAGVVRVVDESLESPPPGVYSAPGRDVPTTQPGGRWFLVNGSSYAAAHVSGLFALIRERGRRTERASALVTTRTGGAAIDACATLLRAAGPCDCACAKARQVSSLEVSAVVRQ